MNKYFFIFFSFILSQGLNTNTNYYDRVDQEVDVLLKQEISPNLFIWPVRDNLKNDYYDLFNSQNDNFNLNPVLGIRYSSAGFEMNKDIPFQILWITPGAKMSMNKVLISSIEPIWINGWVKFNKHSAYGTDAPFTMQAHNSFNAIGQYNPDISYGFYTGVRFPEGNGIDFDETIGALSLLGNTFDLTLGKLRSSLGPSMYSNLSLSNTFPAFNQLRIHYNYKDKIYFTFIAGDLFSDIKDSSILIYESDDINGDGSPDYSRLPFLQRRVYNHRLDFKLFPNFRLGFYEQVIAMHDGSFSYLNPFSFYWSEQHQSGDFNNLQMGFDFDWIIGSNRLYGGLLIDEWAPYETFNSEQRNWFATQLGFSKLIQISNKYLNKLLFKFEYSAAEPQVYVHKFEINNPEHHGYPIGLWSGGDSIDRRLNLIFFIKSTLVNMGWNNTRIGEAVYDEDESLLLSECNDIKIRDVLFLEIKKDITDLNNNDTNIDFSFKVSYYDTRNLYENNNFLDVTTSLVYNLRN